MATDQDLNQAPGNTDKEDRNMQRAQSFRAMSRLCLPAVGVVVLLTLGRPATGAISWNGDGDGTTWSQGANWVGGAPPPSAADIELPGGAGTTIDVDANQTIGSMRVFDTYVLQNSTLILDPSDTWGVYDIYCQGADADIQSNIQLNGNVKVYPNVSVSTDMPIISGDISDDGGSRQLTLDTGLQSRYLSLRGTNTHGGGTVVGSLTLEIASDNPFGSGTVRLQGDGAAGGQNPRIWMEGDRTLNNAIVIADSFMFNQYSTGTKGTLSLTGPVSIEATGVVITEQDSFSAEGLDFDGVITDNGNGFTIAPQQGGRFRFGSANTITGGITYIVGGTDPIGGANAAEVVLADAGALGSGPLTVKGHAAAGRRGYLVAETGPMTIANDIVLDNSPTAGTLLIGGNGQAVTMAGAFSGAGNVTFTKDATFTGTGAIGGTMLVQLGATLSVGASPGSLTVNGDLRLGGIHPTAGDTLFVVDLTDSTPGTGHDQVVVNGAVNLYYEHPYPQDGTQLVLNLDGPKFLPGDLAFLIVNDGTDAITGNLTNPLGSILLEGATVDLGTVLGLPATAQISYFGNAELGELGTGNDLVLFNFTNAFVPEPATAGILLLSALCLLGRRRRRGEPRGTMAALLAVSILLTAQICPAAPFVWASVGGNNGAVKIDSTGSVLASTSGVAQTFEAICVDGLSGQMYAWNNNNGDNQFTSTLYSFDGNGNLAASLGGGRGYGYDSTISQTKMAIDGSGNAYVTGGGYYAADGGWYGGIQKFSLGATITQTVDYKYASIQGCSVDVDRDPDTKQTIVFVGQPSNNAGPDNIRAYAPGDLTTPLQTAAVTYNKAVRAMAVSLQTDSMAVVGSYNDMSGWDTGSWTLDGHTPATAAWGISSPGPSGEWWDYFCGNRNHSNSGPALPKTTGIVVDDLGTAWLSVWEADGVDSSGFDDKLLIRIDLETGQMMPNFPIDLSGVTPTVGLALDEAGYVWMGTQEGDLYRFPASGGTNPASYVYEIPAGALVYSDPSGRALILGAGDASGYDHLRAFVPEPSTATVLGLMLAALLRRRSC